MCVHHYASKCRLPGKIFDTMYALCIYSAWHTSLRTADSGTRYVILLGDDISTINQVGGWKHAHIHVLRGLVSIAFDISAFIFLWTRCSCRDFGIFVRNRAIWGDVQYATSRAISPNAQSPHVKIGSFDCSSSEYFRSIQLTAKADFGRSDKYLGSTTELNRPEVFRGRAIE